jgi:bifunctional non-homologous end joining protein LigD
VWTAGALRGRGKQTVRVGSRTIELSSLDKIFYPGDGYTKGDVVAYYARIADTMLPYLKDRPVSMQRFPDGIKGGSFFQKDISDHFPDWIPRVTLPKKGGEVTHVLCNDAATLVYLANQACLVPHVWLSRGDQPDHPDWLIFDLDPAGTADFDCVRRAALIFRGLLEDELGLAPFAMTTGSRGIHVTVPVKREKPYDAVRGFARVVAGLLAARHPDLFTVEHLKVKRGDLIYIDTNRNGYAQTAVPPYSLRAVPGAPVATPLAWSELERAGRLDAQTYTITTVFRRLARVGDPWAGMRRKARSLDGAMKKVAAASEKR